MSSRISIRRLRPGFLGTTTRGAVIKGVQRGLESTRHLCRAILLKATRRHGKVVFQTFLLGWHTTKIADPRCLGGWRHHVYNTAPYAAVIELGRRPGARMPPPDALKPWVEKKLKPHKEAVKAKRSELRDEGRRTREARRAIKAAGGNAASAKSLANAHKSYTTQAIRNLTDEIVSGVALNVARAIAFRGIKATPIVGERVERLADLAVREVKREIKLSVGNAFRGF